MRAVQFEQYGPIEVLEVRDLPDPEAGEGRVVVEVRAAGTNPGEASIRSGLLKEVFPSTFPSGQGSDLAGVVTAVGEGVTQWQVGDEVLGWSWERSSQAELVAVPAEQLIAKPAGVSWEVAGSLYVAGCTAWAAIHAVGAQAGETVAVSAAAGGVGTLVVQMLVARGVTVLGIASEANAEWLRSKGATPVTYGDGLADRLQTAAPDGIDAFIDLFGEQYVRLAVDLGVAEERINTIIAFAAAQELGTKSEGSSEASRPEVLQEVVDLVAAGTVEVPIAASYPLEQVQDAFRELEQRHTRGKIVLLP